MPNDGWQLTEVGHPSEWTLCRCELVLEVYRRTLGWQDVVVSGLTSSNQSGLSITEVVASYL